MLFPCYKHKDFCQRQSQPGFQKSLSLCKLTQAVNALQPNSLLIECSSDPLSSYFPIYPFSVGFHGCHWTLDLAIYWEICSQFSNGQIEFSLAELARAAQWEEGSSSILTAISISVIKIFNFYIYLLFKLESCFWYCLCWKNYSWLL